MSRTEAMIVDMVDSHDRTVGCIARGEVFAKKANFRVVHVFVFNAAGELLLQKLPVSHKRHPGFWGSSVAGYVLANESYPEAASRRLRQELGVDTADLHFYGKTAMNDEGCKKFVSLFVVPWFDSLSPDSSHIEALEYLTIERIQLLDETGERPFTPTFLHVLEFYLAPARV